MYVDRKRDLPKASKPRKNERLVPVPVLPAIKLLLYSAMKQQAVRKADLARRLKISKSGVDHMLSLHHQSRLPLLEAALAALHKKIQIDVIDTAA